MPTTPDAIAADITEAATAGFRGRLIARGQALAIIWRDGALPPDAPAFAPQLSYDFHSYAYALLGLGLRLRELGGDAAQARTAFEQAATALETVIAKGNRQEVDRDFHFVMAAASYHLAHLSARAYSLLTIVEAEENFSPIERVLAQLMRRNFGALRATVLDYRASGEGSDARIAAAIQANLDQAEGAANPVDGGSNFRFDGLDTALTDAFLAAMSLLRVALERGERPLLDQALDRLRVGLAICSELNMLPQWWAHRIAIHLLSALYGSIGVSGFDEDAIRERDIVVATPEKLDFALRNDPSLLDDVGLLVFDEGHMIGLNEREVRYEVQIQRLLHRPDAHERRIVCLSAILPDGDQLDDFAAWLRRDHPGGLIKNDWRPTRLRFGEVAWTSPTARLNLRVGDERPWVQRFLTGAAPPNWIPPKRRRTRLFPDNQRELCLATAWRLIEDGQTVLIFSPERRSVEPFAHVIVDLHERGALRSLLQSDPAVLDTAIALGEEWLGPNSGILKCLRLGVALHHGALPNAYRKEGERLLRENVLKVTISSPTLAQGLNLSATAVVMHSLHRNGEKIEISEFKNVIGRAGRAYVDVEGIVLFPMFDDIAKKRRNWEALITDLGARELESAF